MSGRRQVQKKVTTGAGVPRRQGDAEFGITGALGGPNNGRFQFCAKRLASDIVFAAHTRRTQRTKYLPGEHERTMCAFYVGNTKVSPFQQSSRAPNIKHCRNFPGAREQCRAQTKTTALTCIIQIVFRQASLIFNYYGYSYIQIGTQSVFLQIRSFRINEKFISRTCFLAI